MIINSVFFNKFLNNNAVRKSINIIIYTVLLAQGNALAASSGSVSQTFSDKWSGLPTVRDMGAKMAGAVTDEMAIQQAFDMAPGSTGVINVPSGIWPAVNGSIFSPVKRDINKTVLWNFLGPVVSAGRPVGGVGSGDVTETYISNSKNFWRRWDSATSDAPIVRIALDNYAGNWHTDFQGPGTPLALGISAFSHPGSNGNTVAERADVYSFGKTNGQALDQVIAFGLEKGGTNGAWLLSGQITDVTYAPPVAESWAEEMDIVANGDDDARSVYDVSKANRVFHFMAAKTQQAPRWSAFHRYSVGNAVQGTVRGGCGIYKVVKAGTSGRFTPAWNLTTSISDGTTTWAFSEWCSDVVGTGVEFTSDAQSRFNTGIGSSHVMYDNAFLDLALATNNPNAANGAMIRLASGGAIDWSADGTAAGKDRHVTFYNPSAGFLYEANGNVEMSIKDDGSVSIPGSVSTGSATVNSITANGQALFNQGTITPHSACFTESTSGSQTSMFQGADKYLHTLNGAGIKTQGLIASGTTKLADVSTGSIVVNGTVQLTRMSKAAILGLTAAKEGMKVYDIDDHAEVTYRCPTTKTCRWFPTQYGKALSN